jgi:hypothetical protein
MTILRPRAAATLLAIASLTAAGRGSADDASADCRKLPTADALEKAARSELGACTSVTRTSNGEVSGIWGRPELTGRSLRAFIGNHPRELGIASVAELTKPAEADPFARVTLRQTVPGVPEATVYCHPPAPSVGPQTDEPPWAIRGIGGHWEICLLPDLANAAKRRRIGESAARAVAVAESRDSGDEAPRASSVRLIARRRHVLYERRGVLAYRVTVLEAIGTRYVDVEADTAGVLDSTWTSESPTPTPAPSEGAR